MATARHPKAIFFVQRQLFSGLSSFAGLEQKIAALPDEQARGAAFEVFAEAYLATQRKHDAAQVWPHGSVPLDILKNLGLTQQDQGVDGVLQTLLGEFSQNPEISGRQIVVGQASCLSSSRPGTNSTGKMPVALQCGGPGAS